MEQKTIKDLFVNGGPRKNKNTAQMLESAMKGAKDAGAEYEMVNLYDLDYKGCKSWFASLFQLSHGRDTFLPRKADLPELHLRLRQTSSLVYIFAYKFGNK